MAAVIGFFRQVEAWRFLEERVLPKLVADAASGGTIRAWVAGCATGKEAYTLAMLLLEAVAASGTKTWIQIFATDADEAALDVARIGVYQEAEIRNVAPVRLRRFFERRGKSYRVTKKLRETIVFARQNITSDPPLAKLDLVSCRNLLTYLDVDAQRQAITVFHFALRAGGCLFLGSAESLAGHDELFAPLSKKWRIFRSLAVTPAAPTVVAESSVATGSPRIDEELGFMRTELQSTIARLEVSNEELWASNAEALAGNDALQAANEELQAANEELQAVGEELQSLNAEFNAANINLQEKNDQLKAAEAESARLASFPERNPNPVVETDPAGRVSYLNPAARALFPDLAERGLAHPWLAQLQPAAENILRTGARQILREVSAAGATFEQAFSLVAETGKIRIYGRDVTERRRSEEEIKRHAAILNGINTIFRTALGCTTEEELGRACLATAEVLTRSTFGFIGELGADGLLHDTALSDPGWALCTMHDKAGHRRRQGDFKLHGLYGRVLLDGKSFFTNDPASHPDSIGTPEGHPPLTSFLGVPLRREEKVIGVIAMGNREGGYRRDDLDSLEALAPAIVEALQRARTELALNRSEERLERAQSIAHLGSWELDLTDKLLIWSDEVYRIIGLEPQEFAATYEAFLEYVHPEDRAAVDAAYSDSVRQGRDSYEMEHRVVRRSTGEIRVVHEKCEHFRDGTGRIVRSVGMIHDITERKQVQEALTESLRRFELLAHAAGELLQAPEPQKIVEALCRRVMDYLDCDAFFNFLVDEGAGKLRLNAYDGITEEDAQRLRWLDYGVAVCGCAVREGRRFVAEHIPTTPDARTELVKFFGITAYACQPLLAPDGKVLGTLSFGTRTREVFSADDLSLMQAVADLVAVAVARMQGAELLRRTVAELARSNQDLEQFAYVSSHDLQEPLRAVSGFLTLLESRYRDELDERAQTYIAHAVEGSQRMTQLIDGLLEYARLDTRGGRVSHCVTQEALAEVLASLRPRLEEIGARVTVEDLPVLGADRTQVVQLFQNLLGNAIKFRREGAPCEIHVGAQRDGDRWVLSVRDNGIGIAAHQLDRIFLIFQRLHTRGKYPGTGIGLAICKRIVERHGGRIWVESAVGVGSTFLFTLPEAGAVPP